MLVRRTPDVLGHAVHLFENFQPFPHTDRTLRLVMLPVKNRPHEDLELFAKPPIKFDEVDAKVFYVTIDGRMSRGS